MEYFATLPTISTNKDGSSVLSVNILTRAKIREDLSNVPELCYNYTVQEGDTPDIIASKYYDSSSRYWIFLYANNFIDPQWDYGMDDSVFLNYLQDKYGNDEIPDILKYCHDTDHSYYKIIEKYDSLSGETTTDKIRVSKDVYDKLESDLIVEKHFSNGNDVTVKYGKEKLSIYEYEYNKNLENRNVRVLRDIYATTAEKQLKEIYK